MLDLDGDGRINLADHVASEFRIHTDITGHQLNLVDMDDDGDFVVVWSTADPDFSFFNDVRGQIFTNLGERPAWSELINATTTPARPPSRSTRPWSCTIPTAPSWQPGTPRPRKTNGVVTNASIIARRFATGGLPLGGEFQVDDDAGSGSDPMQQVSRNPQDGHERPPDNSSSSGKAMSTTSPSTTSSGSVSPPMAAAAFRSDQPGPVRRFPSQPVGRHGHRRRRSSSPWNGEGGQPHPLNPSTDLIADRDDEGVFLRRAMRPPSRSACSPA